MDAIILAGGIGKRMQPLTAITPKPLLRVQGRPILEWSLRALPKSINHVMVVVNYLREQVADYMASQDIVRDYTLVEQQPHPLGTGHAVHCCQLYIRSQTFMVLNGDDLYDATSLDALAHQPLGILGSIRDDAYRFGVLQTEGKLLKSITEKPPTESTALVNAGAYKMDQRIFEWTLKPSMRNEYEITDYVQHFARHTEVQVVSTPFWFPIGTPDALIEAQSLDLDTWIKVI